MNFPGSLHCHTEYSNERLRDCIIRPEKLIDRAIELGHECVAITDHETISSYVRVEEYYDRIKETNPAFKVIRGNEIYLTRNGLNASNYLPKKDRYFHFILLCKDIIGYRQICELSTRAWHRSYKNGKMRRVPTYYQDLKDVVGKNPGHLIASTACLGSQLDRFILDYKETNNKECLVTARKWCKYIEEIFGKGNFYLEMQPSSGDEQIFVNKELLKISRELDIPYIITLDAHYLNPEDAPIHEAFLNAQDGDREVKSFYETTYLMGDSELRSYFKYFNNEEIEEAYKNIKRIKEQCEDFSIKKPLEIPSLIWRTFPEYSQEIIDDYCKKLPSLKYFIESKYKADNTLVYATIAGIENKKDLQNEKAYAAIDKCLEMTWVSSEVNNARWSAYYLNLQKTIDECWNAGSIVMPGRGSGVGFVLLYVLDVIQINCLEEKTATFPWRFLNPERVSVLDIDTDVSGIKRAQILQHLREFYGEDKVSCVATFKVEKSKSAILTAARGLGIDVDEAQYISSLVTLERGQPYTLKQMYYGDEENGIKPSESFRAAINKHEHLWEVASGIEGIICGYGIHAGGIIFVDKPFTETCALMRAPDGTIVTQFELHDSEKLSLIKIDLLSVECADRIQTCLELLIEYGYIKEKETFRETYESVIGINNLNRYDNEMWDMVRNHRILSLFQMEKESGIHGIALSNPRSVDDLAVLNSVIRLMPQEKGAETPLETWSKYRKNINIWLNEMRSFGLTEEEVQWLASHNAITNGICESQEGLMSLVQEPRLGGNSLKFADKCRKAIAKKQGKLFDECEKEFFDNIKKNNCSEKLADYVWNVLIMVQKGYSFNRSHCLAYSLIALQEMNLAYKYPILFWNTANLIVDSAGIQSSDDEEKEEEEIEEEADAEEEENEEIVSIYEAEEWEEYDYEDLPDRSGKKKKKVKTVDYGKIATAIGRFKNYGIAVSTPDINTSGYTFTPFLEKNEIRYGLRGITRLSADLINEIIAKRPFDSLDDFMGRVKTNKLQMTNLIKCGAFDNIEAPHSREEIMFKYLDAISDKKSRLTLQNMQALIDNELIPEDMVFYGKLFLFNKHLKKCKQDNYYKLGESEIKFISTYFDLDMLDFGELIQQATWDKLYKKTMEAMRVYLKKNEKEILDKLNGKSIEELKNKYAQGNVSRWEMDSLSFYAHPHELDYCTTEFDNFFSLPEDPIISHSFTPKKSDVKINIYQLFKFAGTVLKKDKNKNTVTLLTQNGVVDVKIYKNQFALFDKQVSALGEDGKKHVVEPSWFKKGTLLIIQGFRRGNNIVPKKYSDSVLPVVSKIESISSSGEMKICYERAGE